jgi:nickel-type superoxide dismutase maturation protease
VGWDGCWAPERPIGSSGTGTTLADPSGTEWGMYPNDATLPRLEQPAPRRSTDSKGRWTVPAAVVALLASTVLARTVRRVVVKGGSMAPLLLDGDRLVVLAPLWGRPRVVAGDVVAVSDPRAVDRLLVKRVAALDRLQQTVEVLGDVPEASTDSRTFGPVPLGSVLGRVAYRYGPPGRTGPLVRPKEYHRT